MIYRHSDEQIQAYFDSKAINQSIIKIIIDKNKGIEYFTDNAEQLYKQEDLYYEEKTHFIIGNGVDCIISQGTKVFKNKYHYSDLKKKPSAIVMAIVREVYDKITQTIRIDELQPFIYYKKEIWEVANTVKDEKGKTGYSMNRAAPTEKQLKENPLITDWWNYDTRWSSMKNAEYYWDDLKLANGKQVLDEREYNTINNIVLSFTTHKFTKHLFVDTSTVDIVYQMPIYWEYNGVQCKGLIDHIIIDHAAKKIKPIDEKTFGDYVTKFGIAVRVRRYDVQGSFYSYGLSLNLEYLSNILGRDVTDYTISNFAFVTESSIKQGTPLIYPMSNELMDIGFQGDRYLLGWQQGLAIYRMWEGVGFSVENRYASSNGIVWLDQNFENMN